MMKILIKYQKKTDTVEKIDESNKQNDETDEADETEENLKQLEDSIEENNEDEKKESEYKEYKVIKPYLDKEFGRVVGADERISLTETRAEEIIEKLPGYIELITE